MREYRDATPSGSGLSVVLWGEGDQQFRWPNTDFDAYEVCRGLAAALRIRSRFEGVNCRYVSDRPTNVGTLIIATSSKDVWELRVPVDGTTVAPSDPNRYTLIVDAKGARRVHWEMGERGLPAAVDLPYQSGVSTPFSGMYAFWDNEAGKPAAYGTFSGVGAAPEDSLDDAAYEIMRGSPFYVDAQLLKRERDATR